MSEVISISKENYPHYQKMIYGVYLAVKKLKHYFQEHPITMVCEAPISENIGCKDATGRVAKWAIEISPYRPHYERRDDQVSSIARVPMRLGRDAIRTTQAGLQLLEDAL